MGIKCIKKKSNLIRSVFQKDYFGRTMENGLARDGGCARLGPGEKETLTAVDQFLGCYYKQLRTEMINSRVIIEGRINKSLNAMDGQAIGRRWIQRKGKKKQQFFTSEKLELLNSIYYKPSFSSLCISIKQKFSWLFYIK